MDNQEEANVLECFFYKRLKHAQKKYEHAMKIHSSVQMYIGCESTVSQRMR